MRDVKLEDIVSLAKRRGFIYPGSDVYGGLSGTWDYGPLGVALKRNIMQLWWKMFVEDRDDMLGVDAAILMNQKVWQASGHTETFTDPLTVCNNCKERQRVDKLIDEVAYKAYVNDVLVAVYEDLWNNYKQKTAQFDVLKQSNQALGDIVQEDHAQFTKLQDAQVNAEVYSDWAVKAKKRLDDYIANQNLIGQTYDFAFTYLDLLSYVLHKNEEARAYLGEFAKTYLNSNINCPKCGARDWKTPQTFNMMFRTNVGPVDDADSVTYLRPETAQGIFTNFKNVVDSFYPDVPFGIAQQGKAFRNEISPRDFVFRAREFEQMEIEYFVHPEQWKKAFEKWIEQIHEWCKALGLPDDMVHELEVPKADRAHYSQRTVDFEFDFPIGREELLGLAYRTDFDLMNIQKASGKSMEYRPKDGSAPFVPHVIEPSFGVERAIMAVLTAAYTEDEINGEKRTYLKLPPHLAPVKAAVSPLLKNKPELVAKAREVYRLLKNPGADMPGPRNLYQGAVMWDDNGNVGKRYRRQDEIGTPECITIDFQTLDDDTVTIRDRDTTNQTRMSISDLKLKSSWIAWT